MTPLLKSLGCRVCSTQLGCDEFAKSFFIRDKMMGTKRTPDYLKENQLGDNKFKKRITRDLICKI